ncbi:MAG: hypothetical protein ACFB5Z_09465 [Elainellaceae cyanobacterium]
MWRDEIQAWLLARDSDSIVDLFQNMTYEGHPGLWHLCLYGLSQITANPLIMQMFHLLISIGIVYLLVKRSPFPTFHRALLPFGYFIFFEYTFISRSYNIGVFLLFLFCVVYAYFGRRYLALSAIIMLLANTSAYGFLVGLSLMLFLSLSAKELSAKEADAGKSGDRWKMPTRLIFGLAIAGLGCLISALQIIRGAIPQITEALGLQAMGSASGQSLTLVSAALGAGPLLPENIRRFVEATADIWRSYTAVPALFQSWFWNSNILDILSERFDAVLFYGVPIGTCIAFLISPLLVLAVAYLLSADRTVLSTYLLGTSALVLFKAVVYDSTSARHRGHLFIILIVCFWLMEVRTAARAVSSKTGPPQAALGANHKRSLRLRFLSVILCLQAISGLYAASADYLRPFSAGEAAATFIQQQGLAEAPIFGSDYRHAAVISGYLNTPIYYPEKQDVGSFWTSRLPEIEDQSELIQQIEVWVAAGEDNRLLVLTEPLALPLNTTLKIEEVVRFEDAISLEKFYLYMVTAT